MHPADEREFVVAWEIAFSEVVVLSIEKGQLKPVNSGCICPYILEGEVSMNQWIKLAAACKTVQHNRYFGAGNSTTEITELTHILGALGDFPDAILWTQAKSLQAHLKGDLARAILFRKREIEMTIQLHSEGVQPAERGALSCGKLK